MLLSTDKSNQYSERPERKQEKKKSGRASATFKMAIENILWDKMIILHVSLFAYPLID